MYSSIKYLDKSLAAIYNSSFVIEADTNLDLNEIKAYEIKDNPHYHGIENEKKLINSLISL